MHYMFGSYLNVRRRRGRCNSSEARDAFKYLCATYVARSTVGMWHFMCSFCINTWSKIHTKWPNQPMKIEDKLCADAFALYVLVHCAYQWVHMHELLLHLSYDNMKTINNIIKKPRTRRRRRWWWLWRRDFIFGFQCLQSYTKFTWNLDLPHTPPNVPHFHFPNQARIHLEWHIIEHIK